MKAKEEKMLVDWAKNREKGKWHFVLKNGFIFMLLMLIIGNLIEYGLGNFPTSFFTFKNIVGQLISKAIGGFIFGVCMWYFQEKSYKKLLQKKQNESNSK